MLLRAACQEDDQADDQAGTQERAQASDEDRRSPPERTRTKPSLHEQILRPDGDHISGLEAGRFKDIALARLPV